MVISLTCSCGARLEIDEKFAGQVIPCPDCQRPLNTAPAEAAPERTISGLALASLIVALVGAFTVVGSLAAVALGLLAVRQIAREPDRLGGLRLARAGMALGGFFTFVTVACLAFDWGFGVDAILREFRRAAEVDYNAEANGFYRLATGSKDDPVGIQRPSRSWGKLKSGPNTKDALTLLNLWEDAHLVCLEVKEDGVQAAREKAAELFRQSDLYRDLSKGRGAKDAKSPDPEAKPVDNNPDGDLKLEVRLGGHDRTFLLRVVKVPNSPDIYLLVGGARTSRFSRLAEEIRDSFKSFKRMEN
jgi:hypothetical protein